MKVARSIAILLSSWGLCCLTGVQSAAAAPALQVAQEEVFLMPAPTHGAFEIVEVWTVRNPAPTAQDVDVSLPNGYQSLAVTGVRKGAAHVAGNQLVLRGAAGPQTSTVLSVSFVLPLDGQQGLQFTVHAFYPADVAHLLLPIGNAALSAQGLLTSTQTTVVAGTRFRVFTRPGIPAGDDWTLSLQELPSPTPDRAIHGLAVIGSNADDAGNTLQAIGNLLLAGFVLVIGLLSIRSIQWGRASRVPVAREEALFRAWEETERRYADGRIEAARYEQQRRELRDALVRLRRQGDGDGGKAGEE